MFEFGVCLFISGLIVCAIVAGLGAIANLFGEDHEQEKILSNLEHRKPRSQRRNQLRELSYGLRPGAGDVPVWAGLDEINYDAIERLADWTIMQAERVQQAVFTYLDNPTDNQLFRITALLELRFPRISAKPGSLLELQLRSMPCTLEDMYELARREHPSKRPEAAVRANLRNLVERGEVELREQKYCKTGKTKSGRNRKDVSTNSKG